uniref:Orn/DAP/Arg decarboxylase 2 N-terminal domain-containing protein n=1 Tax=Anopheles atroparvus TaxID=41427 RepID=A0AAG5DNR0_ANOAO
MDHPRVYAGSAEELLEHLVAGGPTETSTNILDLDELVSNVYRWKEAHPGLTPFYSPCVNNHPLVLAVLEKLAVGFSCASRKEMCTVLGMGVPAGRVWLAHPCKTPDAILCAQQNQIDRIACDSVQEVAKVIRLHPTARIVLRIRLHPEQKFGCCPTVDLPEILNFARSASARIVGVHVAIPQGKEHLEEPLAWLGRGLREAKATIEHAHRMGLNELQELVLSGVDHVPPAALQSELTALSLPTAVTVIIETDRALVESAVTLVTNVQSKRVIRHAGLSSQLVQEIMYFLNDGRYGSFEWWKAIDKPPTVRRMNETGSPATATNCPHWPTSLWGPTCDSADIICERLELPELEVGDFLVFRAMGAYGATVASRFNGFPIPRTVACARHETTRALLDDNQTLVPIPRPAEHN